MKTSFFSLFTLSFLASCSFDKVAEVSIKNENKHRVAVTILANNIVYNADTIAPQATHKGKMNWTDINQEPGNFKIVYGHEGGQVDTFLHGQFSNGTLCNYIDITILENGLRMNTSD